VDLHQASCKFLHSLGTELLAGRTAVIISKLELVYSDVQIVACNLLGKLDRGSSSACINCD